MKTKIATTCVIALAMTSFAASAAETASIQSCMESFADQNFPGRVISYRAAEEPSPMQPLIASTGTQSVAIVATDAVTGRVLATASCRVKELGRRASVIVGMVDNDE